MSTNEQTKTCGIVMPISALDGCSEAHWAEVLDIISEAIAISGLQPKLVSDADDSGIIHKRIIQNLYDNPIVVCDVSGKNPNVMFELGLRLAFDKPTVIIKDERTSYSFDTSTIEHIEYPRDLRFARIVEFKKRLADKILATYQRAASDPNYSTFLKHFGEFKVAKLDKKEISGQEYILEEIKGIRDAVRRMEVNQSPKDPKKFIPRATRVFGDVVTTIYNADSLRVDQLGLSESTMKALYSAGIIRIEDLTRADEIEVGNLSDELRRALPEIKLALSAYGLAFTNTGLN